MHWSVGESIECYLSIADDESTSDFGIVRPFQSRETLLAIASKVLVVAILGVLYVRLWHD